MQYDRQICSRSRRAFTARTAAEEDIAPDDSAYLTHDYGVLVAAYDMLIYARSDRQTSPARLSRLGVTCALSGFRAPISTVAATIKPSSVRIMRWA